MIGYYKMRKLLGNSIKIYQNSTYKQIDEILQKYYKKNELLPGYCDENGTQIFTKINKKVHEENWRTPKYLKEKIKISSIGLGTQSGNLDNETDKKMFKVLFDGIKDGKINTIDTDVNFRYGKSQKIINAVLHYLHHEYNISRNSIFIASKCGYIPNDVDCNLDDKAFIKMLVDDQKYITKEDIVNEVHCLHPHFIQFSLGKSLLSLGIETIDLLYLNNPTQSQQTVIGKAQYFERLEKAFECLQILRADNKIRYYGIASFISFRSPPDEQLIHVELNEIVSIAQKVKGRDHGLRFILTPFNLKMPEVLLKWQVDRNKVAQNIFKIAEQSEVNINFCCPLFQGKLSAVPFKTQILNYLTNNSGKHIQLVRSLPKPSILSTYFSTLNPEHLHQTLQVVQFPYLTVEEWKKILPV